MTVVEKMIIQKDREETNSSTFAKDLIQSIKQTIQSIYSSKIQLFFVVVIIYVFWFIHFYQYHEKIVVETIIYINICVYLLSLRYKRIASELHLLEKYPLFFSMIIRLLGAYLLISLVLIFFGKIPWY